MAKTLDRLDRRILEELQAMPASPTRNSPSASGSRPPRAGGGCGAWRAPASSKATPRCCARRIGLPILAYALVSLENHHPESVRQFDQLVKERPEVLECHSMSGANDYLLRIVAASMEAYEHFLSTQLLQLRAVRSVNTSFVLRTKKLTTRLPVG